VVLIGGTGAGGVVEQLLMLSRNCSIDRDPFPLELVTDHPNLHLPHLALPLVAPSLHQQDPPILEWGSPKLIDEENKVNLLRLGLISLGQHGKVRINTLI